MLTARITSVLGLTARRCLSTTACRHGKHTRDTWDERFPVREEDVGPDKKGGSEVMAKALPEQIVAPTGVYDGATGEYIHVPEMVPEFVVPDLTGFELKPYVSYRAKEIKQGPLTAQDIFNSVYAPDIEDDFRDGKIQIKDGKIHMSDGNMFDIAQYVEKKETETS